MAVLLTAPVSLWLKHHQGVLGKGIGLFCCCWLQQGGEDGLCSKPLLDLSLLSRSRDLSRKAVMRHWVLITVVCLLFLRGWQDQNLTLHKGEELNSSQEAHPRLSGGRYRDLAHVALGGHGGSG